jgi:hypothetical protein
MNDQELRQIVRQALARNLGVPGSSSQVPGSSSSQVLGSGAAGLGVQLVPETVPFGSHVSHAMYLQLVNSGGQCVIEEQVSCDHCGYCKSHGH